MKKWLTKGWPALLSVLAGVAVFCFWRLFCPQLLNFHEQFQLFLFDGGYLQERLAMPGGVARYLGEFLVQLYNNFTLGALVLALLMLLLQWLTWRLLKTADGTLGTAWYALSFVPVFAVTYAMGDENLLLPYAVALLLTMAYMVCLPRSCRARLVYAFVGLPLVYWACGPMVLMAAAWLFLVLTLQGGRRLLSVGLGALLLVEAVACVVLSAHLVPYPLERLCVGIVYYRSQTGLPPTIAAVPAVVVLLWLAVLWLGRRVRLSAAKAAVLTVVVAVAGAWVAVQGFDLRKLEVLDYDYMVRIRDWNGIVRKAEQGGTNVPMTVCATNLALAMQGQLGERAFHFYQRGTQGLMPGFERNPVTILVPAEAYYLLGLVNTAQRFSFEAMEALPNYNKSGRCIKRLVETNLVNGQYEVARKYLSMLEKTMFYRKWALRTKELIGNEQAIGSHPEYGWLRQARLTNDFMFSETEIDKICGQLFWHNQNNTMALQYLMLWPLLERDVNKFMSYAAAVERRVKYNPASSQEAIIYAYAQRGQKPPQGYVSEMVRRQFVDFGHVYNAGGQNSPQLEAFRNTLWYYLVKAK